MNLFQAAKFNYAVKQRKTHKRAYEILKRLPKSGSVTGAELGVYRGGLSRLLLKHRSDLTLYLVDSWEGNGGSYQGKSGDLKIDMNQDNMDACLRQTLKVTQFANNRRNVIKLRTYDAVDQIIDKSLDFCFIDADHSYEGCKSDIENYLPKIKLGGWLCGHDYDHPDFPDFGVKKAVDKFAAKNEFNLELGLNYTWFVKI